MEEGFRPPEQYVTSYGDAAVPLSNSPPHLAPWVGGRVVGRVWEVGAFS